jgi:hypothetical protein
MRQAGASTEQIARTLSAERNALKVEFRGLSPPEAVKAFEARNLAKYGDPLGPSVDQLRAGGKSWEQIIEGATRPREQTLVSRITFQLDALSIHAMASGHLCLDLSEQVSWEAFSSYADDLLEFAGGKKIGAAESAEMKIWKVIVAGCELRLVQDDFPAMVSFESSDGNGDEVLRQLHAKLTALRSTRQSN